jgi:hypothetical protein
MKRMNRDIELLLLKLADGGRILRLSEPHSGLCLEKRLDSQESVARQKERWKHVFVAMLERELGTAG